MFGMPTDSGLFLALVLIVIIVAVVSVISRPTAGTRERLKAQSQRRTGEPIAVPVRQVPSSNEEWRQRNRDASRELRDQMRSASRLRP